MKIYPALKARMGDWRYYIVRMKMKEVAREIDLASEIYQDRTLSDAIQRTLDESRVKHSLVNFLARRDDRFFSSLVVAAIGGQPSWMAIRMDESQVPTLIANSESLQESFGILSFDSDPEYYALDGQHRLAAIRMLVANEAALPTPQGFADEEISVVVVLREEMDEDDTTWLRRYRRLFSSLNRYAKPTDADTNIIMDEDDVFAIITRRFITHHPFFVAPGKEQESFKVLTKGKNLRSGQSHFTSLQTLYSVTELLLSSSERKLRGWGPEEEINIKKFTQYRPDEEVIDALFDEAVAYWDGLLRILPDLSRPPSEMRCHDLPENNEENLQDHAGFWPIGQEMIAELVRDLLDREQVDWRNPEEVEEALRPLGEISWELHEAPWKHLLLIGPFREETNEWRIRSEDRKVAVTLIKRILRWVLDIDPLDAEGEKELRDEWDAMLWLHPDREEASKMWESIRSARLRLVGE